MKRDEQIHRSHDVASPRFCSTPHGHLGVAGFGLLLICALLTIVGCNSEAPSAQTPDVERFVLEKETQARQLAAAQTNPIPRVTWRFFDAAAGGDWTAASNHFQALERKSGRLGNTPVTSKLQAVVAWLGRLIGQNWGPRPSGLRSEVWAPIHETYGLLELQRTWDPEWLKRYAREIIQAMPEDSIYFGGTDAGRFAVSCFSESHVEGRPILTLTQNALADITYLIYLNSMYGGQMSVPTAIDSQKGFQQYLSEAQQRLQDDALLTGENVQVTGGRVQVSGQVAVMEINGLLVLNVMEKNPQRQMYLEESFVVDRLYPHMQPCGPIFKLSLEPVAGLESALIQTNQTYWTEFLRETFGEGVAAITNCDSVLRYLGGVEESEVGPDGQVSTFLSAIEARKAFAKLRGAQASWYAWAAQQVTNNNNKQELLQAAELAYLQALILGPRGQLNASSIYKAYSDFLRIQGREEDARSFEELIDILPIDNSDRR